jgi:hypothetical protein
LDRGQQHAVLEKGKQDLGLTGALLGWGQMKGLRRTRRKKNVWELELEKGPMIIPKIREFSAVSTGNIACISKAESRAASLCVRPPTSEKLAYQGRWHPIAVVLNGDDQAFPFAAYVQRNFASPGLDRVAEKIKHCALDLGLVDNARNRICWPLKINLVLSCEWQEFIKNLGE